MYKKTNALILREVRYKEADRILTMMTQTEGKMGAKAPGALRKGSKLGAGTQSLCYSGGTLYEYKGKWSVKEAVTLEEFQGLRLDLARLSLAVYFAECVETLAQEGVPDGEMLQLILNSLYALSRDLCDPIKIKCAFEIRLMTIAGFRPVHRNTLWPFAWAFRTASMALAGGVLLPAGVRVPSISRKIIFLFMPRHPLRIDKPATGSHPREASRRRCRSVCRPSCRYRAPAHESRPPGFHQRS